MDLSVGTSGFAYKEWKGTFYPEKLKAPDFLRFYAQAFRTVEINNTFYRMPKRETLEAWSSQVPENFVFVIKAPQRISHKKRLADSKEDVAYFLEQVAVLGDRLGAVLVQTPNYARQNLEQLHSFLDFFPSTVRVAMEFRHESWFDGSTFECLAAHNAALVTMQSEAELAGPGRETGASQATDGDEVAPAAPSPAALTAVASSPPASWMEEAARITPTADFGYLRLRGCAYSDDALLAWARRIQSVEAWSKVFVFFKHEDEGTGPELARRLIRLASLS